ncbi:MAG: glycosyltransferase family 2 protein [Pseudolabrys sp.]|nr:glycosyltransferase family 2 protein [Pseudolabrys sp.]
MSAIIITRNEAENIAACLDALLFCDERVVVDSASTDRTREIAAKMGARVVDHEFAGFGPQKNFALSLATGDWILSIDADERVSSALAKEILAAIEKPSQDAYAIKRISSFLGRKMGCNGLFPDRVVRLFRRGRARFTDDAVHERVVCEGPIGRLTRPLQHDTVRKLEDALARVDHYSTASAQMIVSSGRRVSFVTGITHGLWAFFRTYVLRLGFLDGREGFLLAVANAEGSYYRYMKAWVAGRARG